MLGSYLSPLAPVVVLLLSAFILSIVVPRLPIKWQGHRAIRYFVAPGLVLLAGLSLLFVRSSDEGVQLLSGWYFFTEENGAALQVIIEETSLPFLFLVILILLAAALFSLPLENRGHRGWMLTLGASASLLFISANRLTLAYAILLFDILIAYYWLTRKQPNLAVAHLLLGIFTTGVLMLPETLNPIDSSPTAYLFGLAYWLRLGLYPFIGIRTASSSTQNYGDLIYWTLSLITGMYLVIKTAIVPLPEMIHWLIVITILLNGLLAWLEKKPAAITRLVFAQALILLLIINPGQEITTAYTFGLALSLTALWITPQLEKTRLTEMIRLWPYLPATAATFTLVGLPFSLNWPIWATFYQISFSADTILVVCAIAFALSSLTSYWLALWRHEHTDQMSAPAIAGSFVAAIPFLIPGVAPFILSTLIPTENSLSDGNASTAISIMAATIIGAIALGYFKTTLINQLNISPAKLADVLSLQWLFTPIESFVDQTGKLILRVNVILEGRHYIGWALLTALIGTLIILLTRNI